jgi:hypothetical protein
VAVRAGSRPAEVAYRAGVSFGMSRPFTMRRMVEFPYIWHWTERARPALGNRKGQRCRVLARGKMNSALVEFEPDGHKVITSRNAFRKVRDR